MNDNKTQKEKKAASYESVRIIPLDDKFMKDKKIHDKVWSYLQLKSYLLPNKKRVVYKTNDISVAEIHRNIARKIGTTKSGNDKFDISKQTISNVLKLYKEIGLIKYIKIIDKYNRNVEVIELNQDFEFVSYIPLETLRFLVNTSNENVIKVYAFLLNKDKWKAKENQRYNFKLKDLCAAIGYSSKAENTTMMRDILKSLKNNGLIEYKESYYITENNTPIPVFILLSVGFIK